MRTIAGKKMSIAICLCGVLILSGCTNWEKKYEGLNVEHENLKGRFENCVTSLEDFDGERTNLSVQLTTSQQTIEELERKLSESSIDKATGFDGMDVRYDRDAGTITVTLENEILFRPGSASLRKTYSGELDRILKVLHNKYSGNDIDVVGHTDSDPIKKTKKLWKDNWELSAERALAVLRYLSNRGIRPGRIRAVAAGQGRPVESNSTTSGKAKNRRVEIVVHVK
jgi:chemotaxis protein MotB